MTPVGDPESSGDPPIVRLDVVESTQGVAWELAERGAADRTVVVAEHQLAGRGRRGRTWHDEPGASLLLSIVVRPRLRVEQVPTLSLATGVAVAEALAVGFGLPARLKWPNDVLVGGRKIAGVLMESRLAGLADPVTTIIGIGMNLRQRLFAGALRDLATSVALETGRPADRDATLAVVLAEFDRWRLRLEREGFGPVRRRWLELSETLGRLVRAGGASGVAVDLDLDGALIVVDGAQRHRIASGEIVEGEHAPRG
jgi:BirA family biotin operon repressor/biotin-[acetyl-CoA-carboxylase] ligase